MLGSNDKRVGEPRVLVIMDHVRDESSKEILFLQRLLHVGHRQEEVHSLETVNDVSTVVIMVIREIPFLDHTAQAE